MRCALRKIKKQQKTLTIKWEAKHNHESASSSYVSNADASWRKYRREEEERIKDGDWVYKPPKPNFNRSSKARKKERRKAQKSKKGKNGLIAIMDVPPTVDDAGIPAACAGIAAKRRGKRRR